MPNREDLQTAFMEGLRKEWEQKAPLLAGQKIVSVYFGGGTPSLLKHEYLAEILSRMELPKDCEISIEANPEECSKALFETFLELGINRLSLGVQSFDDSSLRDLERIHSAQKAKEAILSAYAAGFRNISIDLMYDLPWQTRASWQRTLDALTDLPINHLSLYNLTIEPHTSFYRRREQLADAVPKSDESLALLEMGLQTFEKIGLKRYEISAFARDDMISIHNSGYWTGRPFLGLGPSAFSYWNKKRFRNIANLQRYKRSLLGNESPVDFEEDLPVEEHLRELFAIRLRMLDGANGENLPKDTIEKLKKLGEEALLQEERGIWKLTPRGMLFYDTVAAEVI